MTNYKMAGMIVSKPAARCMAERRPLSDIANIQAGVGHREFYPDSIRQAEREVPSPMEFSATAGGRDTSALCQAGCHLPKCVRNTTQTEQFTLAPWTPEARLLSPLIPMGKQY